MTPGTDPLERAVNNLASSGVAVVVSAGNDGGFGPCVLNPDPYSNPEPDLGPTLTLTVTLTMIQTESARGT